MFRVTCINGTNIEYMYIDCVWGDTVNKQVMIICEDIQITLIKCFRNYVYSLSTLSLLYQMFLLIYHLKHQTIHRMHTC